MPGITQELNLGTVPAPGQHVAWCIGFSSLGRVRTCSQGRSCRSPDLWAKHSPKSEAWAPLLVHEALGSVVSTLSEEWVTFR